MGTRSVSAWTQLVGPFAGSALGGARGRPFDQLQHERLRAFAIFKAVNSRDVRMAQSGKDLRLSLEPRKPIRIGRERFRQDLERHLPVQLAIDGLIGLAHAALTDEGGHVVVAEAGADLKGHRLKGR
jgi:hypothetical protein